MLKISLVLSVTFVLMMFWTTDSEAHNYDIKLTSSKVHTGKNFNMLKIDYAHVTTYNRSVVVFNSSGELMEDVPNDAYLTATAFEKKGTAYSKLGYPLLMMSLCSYMLLPGTVYETVVASSNLPRNCPINKGVYKINDLVMDSSKVSQDLRGNEWQVDIAVVVKSIPRFKISIFVFLDRDVDAGDEDGED